MILKKPYAFLIKYFRIIHLTLAIPIIYLIVKTGNIVSFFSDYVSSNYYTSITNIAGTYINYFMYFAVFFILLTGLAIYFLMRKKEKSTIYYLLLIIFYTILFIMIGVTHSILSSMEINMLEASTARAYRDISYLFYVPQYLFAAFTIFRGIGFDIKKFNFEIDIKELEITDIDSEEFELTFGAENYKIKRNIRRFIREFKYYVLENKFIFTILCSIIIITFGTLIYLNRDVYNKRYKESQTIIHNNLNIKVLGSLLTNRDFGGNLFKDNKYYVTIQLSIENKGKDSTTLDYNNFYLEIKNKRIYPTLDRATYFLDQGHAIKQDTELKSGSENIYVMAYEINSSDVRDEYTLKILEQVTITLGEIAPKYKTVALKPEIAINIEDINTTKLGRYATFNDSFLGYTTFQIKKYQIENSITYKYQKCYENKTCREISDKISANSNSKILLILDSTYNLDKNIMYYKTAKTDRLFPEHFINIKYTTPSGVKVAKIEDLTPITYTNGLILQVPSDIKEAYNIELLITIRNKRYTMKLLESVKNLV